MALAYPLPIASQNTLKKAAAILRDCRLALEKSPTGKVARQDYAEAMREFDLLDASLRSKGVQETRQEFLTLVM